MTRKVVLLHLDALSHEYIERGWLPGLAGMLGVAGIARLLPGLSYEGITASMMTGRPVSDHGVWVHFRKSNEGATWPVELVSRIPGRISRSRDCRAYGNIYGFPARLARKGLRMLGQRPDWDRFHFMPLRWLGRFDFAIPEYRAITSYEDFGDWPTLAGLARQHGMRTAEIFGEWDRVVLELPGLLKSADFVFVHTLFELDRLGHLRGPESREVRDYLRLLDRSVTVFLQDLQSLLGDGGRLLVFSDHGMCSVTHRVDVTGLLDMSLRERGTLLFADSTMLRVWTQEDRREIWRRRLGETLGLELLGVAERAALPASREVLGDVTAVVDTGGLLMPNFWQGNVPVRGMHGYQVDGPWQTAFLSVLPDWPGVRLEAGRPEDVFAVACRAMGIASPEGVWTDTRKYCHHSVVWSR